MNCPLGVDTPLVLATARGVLTAIGKAPEMLVQLADAAIARAEHLEFFKDFYLDQIQELETELQEKVGDPQARIPVDVEGARFLYIPLSGAHTISPAAEVFYHVGESWTLSMFEAANYGIFLNDSVRAKQITERIVLGRNSGLFDEPRRILGASVKDFREMTLNRERNYCCGGGGGLVALPEWEEIRLKAGRPKAEQIRATGVLAVVASCDNCRHQLNEINEHYHLNVQVMGLAELVVNAIVPNGRGPGGRE